MWQNPPERQTPKNSGTSCLLPFCSLFGLSFLVVKDCKNPSNQNWWHRGEKKSFYTCVCVCVYVCVRFPLRVTFYDHSDLISKEGHTVPLQVSELRRFIFPCFSLLFLVLSCPYSSSFSSVLDVSVHMTNTHRFVLKSGCFRFGAQVSSFFFFLFGTELHGWVCCTRRNSGVVEKRHPSVVDTIV